MKTVFDLILALILSILSLPIMLIVILLILLLEQATPFFVQERLGKNKKHFRIYKLRTMKAGKITTIGRIIRKLGIDEIPQLINILKGQMSFIGPRPLTQADVIRLGWDLPYYNQRWSVKPGISGLAQLAPVCHKKMSWFMDKHYVEKQSILLDFKIIALSALVPFLGKAVVKKML